MRVIRTDSEIYLKKPCGIGLGNFDGLHMGHMMLVETLIHECKIEGISSLLYTFETHPENILRKKLLSHIITSNDKKMEILKSAGLDAVYLQDFDEDFSRFSANDFVREILINKFGIRLAVVGENYRFGYKGEGNIELLMSLGREYGFRVRKLPLLCLDQEVVSSTNVRKFLDKGNVRGVADFLGRYFSISGIVVTGKQIGAKIGFPTANLNPGHIQAVPKTGVYASKTFYNGRFYNSITNVGYNPTFGDNENITVETNLFNFDENLYGRELEVYFIERIRGEKKFDSVEDLKKQIKADIEFARNYLVLFNN